MPHHQTRSTPIDAGAGVPRASAFALAVIDPSKTSTAEAVKFYSPRCVDLCAGGELRFHKFCVEKGYLRGTCGFYRKAITFSHPVGGGLLLPPARWKTGTFDERTVEEWKFGRSHFGRPDVERCRLRQCGISYRRAFRWSETRAHLPAARSFDRRQPEIGTCFKLTSSLLAARLMIACQ